MPLSLSKHRATLLTVEDGRGNQFDFEVVLHKRRWPAIEMRGMSLAEPLGDGRMCAAREEATAFAQECARTLGFITAQQKRGASTAAGARTTGPARR